MRQEQSCESVLFVSISLVCVHMAVRVCDCTLTSSSGLVVGEREREREREPPLALLIPSAHSGAGNTFSVVRGKCQMKTDQSKSSSFNPQGRHFDFGLNNIFDLCEVFRKEIE